MSYSYGTTPDSEVTKRAHEQCPDGYRMHIKAQSEWTVLSLCVNVGIDASLEAFVHSTFDHTTGQCLVHPTELHILVRRLAELAERDAEHAEEAESFRGAILDTLGIEEV